MPRIAGVWHSAAGTRQSRTIIEAFEPLTTSSSRGRK